MEFIGPYGVAEGSSYVQGDAAANIRGSYLDIRATIHPMEEIIKVIQEGGLTPSAADRTQLYQAIQALIAAAVGDGVPVGAVMGFDLDAPPTGWIAGDGAAVSRTTYADLDAAKYCGDANNGTATAWYRCTNPASPSGSRSTTGGYIVTRDLRGVFPRFLDGGRGIDTGRVLGSLQKGTLITIDTAIGTTGDGVQTPSIANDPTLATAQQTVGADAYTTTDYAGATLIGTNAVTSNALPGGLGSQGASGVTRPINVSLLGCIKY